MAIHIIFARQRSGTGALGSILDQHKEIQYFGELFHPGETERKENYFNFLLKNIRKDPQRGLPLANQLNYREYMDHVARLQSKQHSFIDVKYSSTHHFNGYWHAPFDMPKFVQFAKNDHRKVIHLKRRNFLKTYISGHLADINKVWHTTDLQQIKTTALHISPKTLMNYLRSTERAVNHFDGYLRRYPHCLELEYETTFQDDGIIKPEVLTSLATFLEVDVADFSKSEPQFVKQTSDDLSLVIENYDEIVDHLKPTPYYWMISGEAST